MLNKLLAEKYIRPLEPLPTGLQPSGSIDGVVRCLIFDIYGTLLISGSGDVGTSMQAIRSDSRLRPLLLEFGIHRSPARLLEDFFSAINQRHAQLKASGTQYPEVKIDHIWTKVLDWPDRRSVRRFALAFELIANPIYPMPGLKRLIGKCRKNGNMGIISNAQFYTPLLVEWFLGAALEQMGFQKDLLIFSYTSECAKPSEYLFQLAKKRLERRAVSPADVLYVGNDMLNDIMPAKKIGFKTALFAGDRRSLRLRENDERCRGVIPDIVITTLSQLMAYL
ncbi:MAG: HAD family hydrolase [Deltaproteobacteria bacterium]|nr:HAD family hydrolase [Deltaproteobacteria bacterium]